MTEQKQMSREIHNKTGTRLYNVWNNIKRRCYTKTNPCYKYYGGRGIKMFDAWRVSFSAFFDWSMKNGYDENAKQGDCTLDRIDINGDYCPENCRWVSMKVQNFNRKSNFILEYHGKKQCLAEWAFELNINPSTLYYRIKRGWSVERALSEMVRANERQ